MFTNQSQLKSPPMKLDPYHYDYDLVESDDELLVVSLYIEGKSGCIDKATGKQKRGGATQNCQTHGDCPTMSYSN